MVVGRASSVGCSGSASLDAIG